MITVARCLCFLRLQRAARSQRSCTGGVNGVSWLLRRWGSGGRMSAQEEGSSSEEDEAGLGRMEELRRERLNALVKRNLTAILLDVTDALFGACPSYSLCAAVVRSQPGDAHVHMCRGDCARHDCWQQCRSQSGRGQEEGGCCNGSGGHPQEGFVLFTQT